MNHCRDSLYAIVIGNNENMTWYVHNRDMSDNSVDHIEKDIKIWLGVGKENRIRYGIQNIKKYEHV